MKAFVYTLLISFIFLGLTSCATKAESRPAKVTYVKVAPRGHKVVYIQGRKYYTWNGKQYRKTRRGYIIVR